MNTFLAIDATELSAGYGPASVLKQFNLKIPAGRWTCIVGPNGAGKSTLLSVLAGLLPHQGQVRYPSRPEQGRVSARQQAQHLAWLGQHTQCADDLTVYDLALLGRLPHRAWLASFTSEDHAAVGHALHTVGAWHWRHRQVGTLSGGERQRVLLARALAVQAPLLLMDEPLASLDPPYQLEWVRWMRALLAKGTTIVSVLHEISMALQADELVVLEQGQLVHHGSSHHPSTHAAVETVFQHSIRIGDVDGRWVALPRLESVKAMHA